MGGYTRQDVKRVMAVPQPTEVDDWRANIQSDARERVVNKIMDTLKDILPIEWGHEAEAALHELRRMSVNFEEKCYTNATSQSDYLQRISLKMFSLTKKNQNNIV